MILDKELFEKALEENKIVRWKNIFKNVTKSYLKLYAEKHKL